jgi:hypothetical protein
VIRRVVGVALAAAAAAGCGSVGQADAAARRAPEPDALSPHWPHIRLQVTDYRIQYQSGAANRAAEYEWTARHFDRVILDFGDKRSVPEYRRLNPRMQIYRYALNWTVVRPGEDRREDPSVSYYDDMRRWYAQNPQYRLEDAFLHDRTRCGRGRPITPACRLTFKIWTQMRWAVNPGDPGVRAYQRQRLAAVAADVDGLFVDEHASGNFQEHLRRLPILEYSDWSRYERDILSLLREVRRDLGPKRMLLNTHTYLTPFDAEMIAAAGGTHAEAFNNPFFPEMERRWRFAESVLGAGGWMDVAPGGDMPNGYVAGNSSTPLARRRLWDLASYYLMVPPQPGALAYNPGNKWKEPFRGQWVAAAAVDVGRPTAARRLLLEGRDPTGRRFRVWSRDFGRTVVLVRPLIEWGNNSFGDASAVEVRLPGALRPIDADGRAGPRVTRVRLRASEAAILLKDGG